MHHDADGGGHRYRPDLFARCRIPAIAGAAAELFPVADRDSCGLHGADAVRERLVRASLRLAVIVSR